MTLINIVWFFQMTCLDLRALTVRTFTSAKIEFVVLNGFQMDSSFFMICWFVKSLSEDRRVLRILIYFKMNFHLMYLFFWSHFNFLFMRVCFKFQFSNYHTFLPMHLNFLFDFIQYSPQIIFSVQVTTTVNLINVNQ